MRAWLEPPFRYVVQGLRDRQADIRLLVIPPVEGPDRARDHRRPA